MSFKYINPGYAKIANLNSNLQINNPSQDECRTGVCYQYFVGSIFESQNSPCYVLDNVDDLSDIWIKFDYFCDNPNYEIFVWLPCANENWLSLYIKVTNYGVYTTYYPTVSIKIGNSGGNSSKSWSVRNVDENSLADFGIKLNKFNEVIIHFTYDKATNYLNGTMDVKINGKTFSHTANESGQSYSETWQNTKKGIYIFSGEDNLDSSDYDIATGHFSNLIISDEEIDANEKIVPLPIFNTQSTMETISGGLYVADKVGEKFLQSPDVYSLADIYDADAKVTGILLVGDPAYTESGTETLISISSRDSVISEHGSFSVTNDTNTLIFNSWIFPSNTTIADLSNMSFGWKASE